MTFPHLLPHLAHPLRTTCGWCISLLAVLLLTSCSSAPPALSRATPAVSATSTVLSSTTPSPATSAPAPVTTPLAPPPQNCALKSPPGTLHLDDLGGNRNVTLVGGEPFWIYGIYYNSVFHLTQSGSQQWPMAKIVVEIGPNYDQSVTLRLHEQETGTLAWWTNGETPPTAATQTLVLNPPTDTEDVGSVPGLPDIPHGSPAPGWKEWGIFPLFSVAGCYTLEVSWPDGSWQSSFAVGS